MLEKLLEDARKARPPSDAAKAATAMADTVNSAAAAPLPLVKLSTILGIYLQQQADLLSATARLPSPSLRALSTRWASSVLVRPIRVARPPPCHSNSSRSTLGFAGLAAEGEPEPDAAAVDATAAFATASNEQKAAAAAIIEMMKTAPYWPGGADQWAEGCVRQGTAGMPELAGGLLKACGEGKVEAVKGEDDTNEAAYCPIEWHPLSPDENPVKAGPGGAAYE